MNKIENDIIEYQINDGILFGRYKVKVLDYTMAVKAVKLRKEFTQNNSYPNLASGINVMSIEKEARDYFATEEATEGVLAGAVMINSIVQATLMNFFLRVSQPNIPTKIFTDEKKAIDWLKQYKKSDV